MNKKLLIILNIYFLSNLVACVGSMNPTGGNKTPNYPYYISTQPMIIKNINIPIGTKLVYEEDYLKSGKQSSPQNEKKLITIYFPEETSITWAGVPVNFIHKYSNPEMKGFSVYAAFEKLTKTQNTRFIQLWKECSDSLGIRIKNTNDWSFNLDNINDIDNCSVNYQRYFKENAEMQNYLDQLYREMQKIKNDIDLLHK